MKLYLVRHGDSETSTNQSEAILTPKGREGIKRLAQFISKLNIKVDRFYHSGKRRAEETASLLASNAGLNSEHDLEILPGIEPLDPITPIIKKISTWEKDALLVGHLPFMTKLVGKLITDDEQHEFAQFEGGSMICLERLPSHQWILHWFIDPKLL